MNKPYDAAMRTLLNELASDILGLVFGQRCLRATPLDADVSTFIGQVDGVFEVEFAPAQSGARTPWSNEDGGDGADEAGEDFGPGEVAHIEFQIGHCVGLIRREFFHNVDIMRKHGKPARTAIVFLTKEAYRKSYTGRYVVRDSRGRLHVFHYEIIKAWELDRKDCLAHPGTMPLAVLTAKSESELPAVFEEMDQALVGHPLAVRELVYTAAYILGGAMWSLEYLNQLIVRDPQMKESVTYRAILAEGEAKGEAKGRAEGKAEGRVEGVAEAILRIGAKTLQSPSDAQRQAVMQAGVARLARMMDDLYRAKSWDELLRA